MLKGNMVVNQSQIQQTQQATQGLILPLESGDRLFRHEFEQLYEVAINIKKAD